MRYLNIRFGDDYSPERAVRLDPSSRRLLTCSEDHLSCAVRAISEGDMSGASQEMLLVDLGAINGKHLEEFAMARINFRTRTVEHVLCLVKLGAKWYDAFSF